ncbi:TonB-dependent receptor [Sphingobium sp. HBC34]|uniref:TonB-dependent receptor n=1 Tax=Sphingobium cyanobacteriorum TaxID=3063954 RepID=A0ABT8ZM06_9SPHN|nr:TonB-dependent receptor [Sphingobium sp. HBC34]MDO7835574.1 TonB-dependent receptor [Sphingobium sp. HBC34]
MMRLPPYCAALALLPVCQSAHAQDAILDQSLRFTLKRESRAWSLRPAVTLEAPSRARMARLSPVVTNDRVHALNITFQRQRHRLFRTAPAQSIDLRPFVSRSHSLLMTVEDRLSLSDTLAVTAGLQGVNAANRNANVTATGGKERIGARDWLLPRIAITFRPNTDAGLRLAYRENMHSFGETGRIGPMGLAHETYRAMAQNLRPETHRLLHLDADWTPTAEATLGIAAFQGRVRERLSFVDHGYQPFNSGSARLQGVRLTMHHRPSRHWRWSVHYMAARLDLARDGHAREHSLALESCWSHGPWAATINGALRSRPALDAGSHAGNGGVRFEGALRYNLSDSASMPAYVSLSLSDPDPLASAALLRDQTAGPVHAADRARGIMLGVGLRW